jgi:SNF2 family DNA or RNA helicase
LTIYTQDIVYLSKILGSQAVRYDGKISSEQKELNKKLFKEDPKIKYLIANTAAMARGHTLTEAETSIYYCNSFDLELRLQSEDRNHRQGTKNNVLYIDLQANKTLDRKIINALRSKKKIADMVLQDPDNLFMEN